MYQPCCRPAPAAAGPSGKAAPAAGKRPLLKAGAGGKVLLTACSGQLCRPAWPADELLEKLYSACLAYAPSVVLKTIWPACFHPLHVGFC